MGLGGTEALFCCFLWLLGVRTEQGLLFPLPEGDDSPSSLSWGRAGVIGVGQSAPTYVSYGALLQRCPWSWSSLAKPR